MHEKLGSRWRAFDEEIEAEMLAIRRYFAAMELRGDLQVDSWVLEPRKYLADTARPIAAAADTHFM